MPKPIPIWDQRMFILKDHCINNRVHGICTEGEFFNMIDISTTSTISQVRSGKQSFRPHSFAQACNIFDVSMDWFYGFTDKMYRMDIKSTPLTLLKEATRLIEIELKQKPAVNNTDNTLRKKGLKTARVKK